MRTASASLVLLPICSVPRASALTCTPLLPRSTVLMSTSVRRLVAGDRLDETERLLHRLFVEGRRLHVAVLLAHVLGEDAQRRTPVLVRDRHRVASFDAAEVLQDVGVRDPFRRSR